MKNFNYGKRIKSSLNTFVTFCESDVTGRKPPKILKEVLELIQKSDKEIEKHFRGNEINNMILRLIRLMNETYRLDLKYIKLQKNKRQTKKSD